MKYWDFTGIELGTHAFTAKIKRWQHFHISQQRYKLFFFHFYLHQSIFPFSAREAKIYCLIQPSTGGKLWIPELFYTLTTWGQFAYIMIYMYVIRYLIPNTYTTRSRLVIITEKYNPSDTISEIYIYIYRNNLLT